MVKNKIKIYAKTLAEEILSGKLKNKETIDNFVKVLATARLLGKVKDILGMAEGFILAEQGKKKIVFETARKVTPSQRKLLNSIIKQGDIVNEKLNSQLIAGIKIIINDSKQFDASMQSKLRDIF
jgi:F0F1-type ATP synthase delta subunit